MLPQDCWLRNRGCGLLAGPRWGISSLLLGEMLCYLFPHLGWIAAICPNRVNRAHWPTKENRQNFGIFLIFPAYGKNCLGWPQIGPGGFFPTNPDLADILGGTDLNFENLYFFHFLDPKFPDAAAASAAASAAAAGRTLRSQPDPSPNAPRDQIRRKVPCCDMQTSQSFCKMTAAS